MFLEGKTALITGGGRGIGRAIALAFAAQGCQVVVAARTADEVIETARIIEETGGQAMPIGCDVAHPDTAGKLVRATRERFNALDILVNNAGYAKFEPFLKTTRNAWLKTLDINLTAPWALAQEAAKEMVKREGGRIINIASVTGHKPIIDQHAYCAAKHGLIGLSKSLALELREHNIAVHCISPGATNTRLANEAMPHRGDEIWLEPEDVAQAALYLASLSPRAAVDDIILRRFTSAPLGG